MLLRTYAVRMGPNDALSPRTRLADGLLAGAEFTHAHWFFGNLYEALVKIPHRVASAEPTSELPRSPLGAGSPGRYYVPLAPLNLPMAAASLLAGWKQADRRSWLILATASSAAGAGATAYLLRSVNPKLFFGPRPLGEAEREPLLRRWYRLHAVRIATSAISLFAIDRARNLGGRRSA